MVSVKWASVYCSCLHDWPRNLQSPQIKQFELPEQEGKCVICGFLGWSAHLKDWLELVPTVCSLEGNVPVSIIAPSFGLLWSPRKESLSLSLFYLMLYDCQFSRLSWNKINSDTCTASTWKKEPRTDLGLKPWCIEIPVRHIKVYRKS